MPLSLLSVRPLGDYVRALILGAKSAIAQAIVERLDGYDFALAARGCSELEPFAADLRLRHSCEVELFEFDALDFAALARLPQQVHERGGLLRLGRPCLRLSRRRTRSAARYG